MSKENNNDHELVEVFTFFHDGLIESIEIKNKSMKLNIIIDFLTQFIKDDFRYFFVHIDNISDLEYMDWTNDREMYSDIETIQAFAQDLWIVKSNLSSDDRVEINCHGGKSLKESSSGGTLLFNFNSYSISDESGKNVNLSDIKRLAKLAGKIE